MEMLTVRKIARSPRTFLRLVVPLCIEVPRMRCGDRYTIFEVLTDADYLVDTGIYRLDEMEEIHGSLEALGLFPFEPTIEVRALVHRIEWELRGMPVFEREYPLIERLTAAKVALEEERSTSARRALREVLHLIHCHSPNTYGNQTPRRSIYIPP